VRGSAGVTGDVLGALVEVTTVVVLVVLSARCDGSASTS
jgi:cobalamin synthase